MAKYKINIKRVENYSGAVIVEADSVEEAKAKVEDAWGEDNGLYEDVTDVLDDSKTEFICEGDRPATEDEIKMCDSLDRYLSE